MGKNSVRIACFLLLFTGNCLGQEWIKMMNNPNVNVHDVQKSFYAWYNANPELKNEDKSRGENAGIELYKQWEHFMVPRTYPTGARVDRKKIAADYLEFKKSSSGSARVKSTTGGTGWSYAGNSSIPQNGGDGRVNHLKIYPGNTNILFACTPDGGLWKSINGGSTWSTNTDQLADLAVDDLVFDPINPNIMYIGTGDGEAAANGLNPSTAGVFKSTDGGTTWKTTGMNYSLSTTGPYYEAINQMQINPSNGSIVWAASSFGLWRSLDSARTWTNVISDNIKSLEFEPFHPMTMYAGSYDGHFYRSVNGGTTFTQVTNGITLPGAGRVTVGVTDADSDRVYLCAENAVSHGFLAMYMSTDRGQSFQLQSGPSLGSPNILSETPEGGDSTGYGWYTLPVAVSPTNADSVFSGGVNIWASGDKGVSWSLVTQWYGQSDGPPAYVHADQHSLVFLPGSGSTLFSACDGGVFKSTDGGNTWNDLSSNLEIGQLYSVGLSALTPGLYISGWQDNGTNISFPGWSEIYGGDGEVCFVDYTNDDNLFVSYDDGNLLSSNDGGNTFSPADNGINESGPWTTCWLQDPQNPEMLYAGFKNVWQSPDQGNSWTQLSTWGTSTISALAVAPSNDKVIYAAQEDSLFLSTNAGQSWKCINGTLPVREAYLSDIAIDPANPMKVWVCFSGYIGNYKVYESVNGGSTWISLSKGLPNLPVNTIAYLPESADGIYAGTDLGVYYRDTITGSWLDYTAGMPNVIIDDLEINAAGTSLYAATYGRGIWQSNADITTGLSPVSTLNKTLKIYPNPSTGRLQYDCSLPSGAYSLSVTNLLGQRLMSTAIPVDGPYKGNIDMSGYSSGVYFLRISGLNSFAEQKIVITR